MQVKRIEKPLIEEFRLASRLCEEHWTHLKGLALESRFEAFQKMGVELVQVSNDQGLEAVCFILPCTLKSGDQPIPFVWLFQLYARPSSSKAGLMMMVKIMAWYPRIMCIGVSPDGEALYRGLRWHCHEPVWRCLHPIRLDAMLEYYGDRLQKPWLRFFLKVASVFYNPFMAVIESLLSLKMPFNRLTPDMVEQESETRGQMALLCSYLPAYGAGDSNEKLEGVDFAGVGRITKDTTHGWWRSLRAHARLWKAYRQRGVKFCEILAPSEKARGRALRLGYVPMSMPIYYWDKSGQLRTVVQNLSSVGFSFLMTDKVI